MGCCYRQKPKPNLIVDTSINQSFLIQCPLNHKFKKIQTCDSLQYRCQVCKQHPFYFFKCQCCSYVVCLKHFRHQQFCPKIKIKCFRTGYLFDGGKYIHKLCMLCRYHGTYVTGPYYSGYDPFAMPAIKCETCFFQSCIKCTPSPHQITNQIRYISQISCGESKCYDCLKNIKGGLTCKLCYNCFCQNCAKRFLQKNITKKQNQCSICLKELEKNKIVLACKHEFHGSCLASWKNRTCPICRSPF